MPVTINGSGQVIVQVIQTVKSDTFSTTSTSFVDITGLSAVITPTSASNRVLVQVVLGSVAANFDTTSTLLLRGSTTIAAGDGAAGVLGQIYSGGTSTGEHYYGNIPTCMNFLDSPATTSATTYKLQMKVNSGTGLLNRNTSDTNQYNGRTISTLVLMEVSG
jgi:hypothetical protein